mgnify:CR=1 FL=1
MKKTILVLIAIVWGGTAFAQQNAITNYFNEYVSDTAFTKVNVTSKMFSLFTEIDSEDAAEKEVIEALSKLKGIKVLMNDNPVNPSALYRDAEAKIAKDKSYEELMSVQDGKENVKFMIKESKGIISELFMIVGGNEQFIVMSLYGEIDLKQIAKLSKIIKMDSMKHLEVLSGDDDN